MAWITYDKQLHVAFSFEHDVAHFGFTAGTKDFRAEKALEFLINSEYNL